MNLTIIKNKSQGLSEIFITSFVGALDQPGVEGEGDRALFHGIECPSRRPRRCRSWCCRRPCGEGQGEGHDAVREKKHLLRLLLLVARGDRRGEIGDLLFHHVVRADPAHPGL